MQTKCVQKSSKPAKNGRFCRPAISSSKWGASLLKVTYGFLWLWSSYFSLTAAQYNTHELFNSSLPNQMGIFSTRWIFWLSLYRTIQVIPASKPYPIHGSKLSPSLRSAASLHHQIIILHTLNVYFDLRWACIPPCLCSEKCSNAFKPFAFWARNNFHTVACIIHATT